MSDDTSDPNLPSDQVYVPLATARKEYWVIETTSNEWLWVLNNIVKKTENVKPNDVLLSPGSDLKNPVPTYLLKKERFPAEIVAKSLGVTVEALTRVKTIRLKPFKQPDDLPAPTVSYAGVA